MVYLRNENEVTRFRWILINRALIIELRRFLACKIVFASRNHPCLGSKGSTGIIKNFYLSTAWRVERQPKTCEAGLEYSVLMQDATLVLEIQC